MKKVILALAVVAFSTMGAQAQDKDMSAKSTTLSIGANVGIPTTTGLSLAYGADLQADFAVAPTTKITASVGYEKYSFKGGGSSNGVVPVLAGAKFFFGDDMKMYGHAQVGYVFSTVSGGGGAFGYAPSLGYYFSPNFDASLKYLAYSKNSYTTGSVNLRLAYNF